MAKLHFKYGTMNTGKSVDLMRTAYNYEENGFKVFVIKPLIDTKSGEYISSRVGLSRKVDLLLDINDNVIDVLKDKLTDVSAIFVDEAQFLTRNQIDDLYIISKVEDVPIICYGLRTDFNMESFEGSKRLLEIADILEQLQSLCECGNISRVVGRMENGEYVTEGESIVIDGTNNIEYRPLCGSCYLQKVKKLNFKEYHKKLGR